MKQQITNSLASAISQVTGLINSDVQKLLSPPKNQEHGDIAFPCFVMAKQQQTSPQQYANDLAIKIELPIGIKTASVNGPYVNFFFDIKTLATDIIDPLLEGKHNLTKQIVPQRVIVEYSSPNIAKPFHVGHLRATLIGNCLDRVFRALGHTTISINHLGDWGTQFGFVWAGCKIWGTPDNASVEKLVDVYRQATDLKAQQEKLEQDGQSIKLNNQEMPDVQSMARQFFIDLENDTPYALDFWRWCSTISLEYLKRTYERMNIAFDYYTGESFYRNQLNDVANNLRQANLLTESQGAFGVDLGEELGFARISTPDGRSLYLTRDLATAEYRAREFNFDKCIYVVGAPQTLHFKQIIGILKALKRDYAQNIVHVAFGHVLGMKTRGNADFIELNGFIDEAENRALTAYREQVTKRPEGLDEQSVAHAVAQAAVMFSTLSRSRLKDVQFKWEQALAFQGDTGPYVLYAYARINGIKEKALEANISPALQCDGSLLTEESARYLILLLADFTNTVERTATECEPSILANYALDVAKAVSKCYLDMHVIGVDKSLASTRLSLFEAAKLTIGRCLELLGITPLNRM